MIAREKLLLSQMEHEVSLMPVSPIPLDESTC